MCSQIDNYTLVEEIKFLNKEDEIEKYYKKNYDNISSIKLLNFDNKTNNAKILINYNNCNKPDEKTVIIKQKIQKYEHNDEKGKFLTNKEYNIFRRRKLNKFGKEDESGIVRASEEHKLVLVDRELADMIGLYAEYYPEFGPKQLNQVIEVKKEEEPVKLMPSFMCAKFGDKNTATTNNGGGFQTNNENAFVLPSLVGVTGGFGSGKVYSVRVDNVDETITQDEFREYMRDFGITNCKDMRLIMKKKKNRDGSFEMLEGNKGFGFIEFFSLVNAEDAVNILDRQRIGYQIISAWVEADKEI